MTLTDEEYDAEVHLLIEAFGMALFTTIHEATKPSGKAKVGRVKARKYWSAFASRAIKFAKET